MRRRPKLSCAGRWPLLLFALPLINPVDAAEPSRAWLRWEELPALPDPIGVAGPFVGVHDDALIVAGGANFPAPVWENDKQWTDRVHVLTADHGEPRWIDGGRLPHPIAYGASASVAGGVVCLGGADATRVTDRAYLLSWDPASQRVSRTQLPPLPRPCAYGQAAAIGSVVYLAGGQSGVDLASAMTNFWRLDLSNGPTAVRWEEVAPWPGAARAFNLTARQHNGYEDCLYVMSGRNETDGEPRFLTDVWEYPLATRVWRRRADAPRCVMAGTAAAVGQSHLLVLGGADGSLFFDANELRDRHPGFPRAALAFHTITNTWTDAGPIPSNQVTTAAVKWRDRIVVPSGEVRPRVRTPAVWSVTPAPTRAAFGAVNYAVLIAYLVAIVGLGVYVGRRQRDTDDYFRGGGRIPWWAAGCSIFATMLSSLTFTGIPAKAYAQDWAYLVGNLMIPVTAVGAVFVALPFFRGLGVTSAYEYLEKRFDRNVRRLGSATFSVFHLFRMAVVMSLTALALAAATPLSAVECVLLMGLLSLLYCTIGGVQAVIWTDTAQTIVLLGGAVVAFGLIIGKTGGDLAAIGRDAIRFDKLSIANLAWDPTNAQLALWVVVVGAIGQNLSSYGADQAVVQRYLTTPTQRSAARAIWTNALLAVPASLLFFAIGTALFAFYRARPERLDPTATTDQIFPHFIATEMPIGLAGLVIAAIFSAAQSTVSTSMNSVASAVVTDFLRPANACRDEKGYLRAARGTTLIAGAAGAALALLFVDPRIKSLFDAFIQVIGLFMGVLGGLFLLGMLSRRATARGAAIGAAAGVTTLALLWRFSDLHGYLYSAIGIGVCGGVGYAASLFRPCQRDLTGLTVWSMPERTEP